MTHNRRRVRVDGPLAPFADAYEDYLTELGYSQRSLSDHRRFLADASSWLGDRQLEAHDVESDAFSEYLRSRKAAGCPVFVSQRGLKRLVALLRREGVIERPVRSEHPTIIRYRHYLTSERGLMASTIHGYISEATAFLAWQTRTAGLEDLRRDDVFDYVLSEARRRSGSARAVVAPLRSFLRFLFLEKVTPIDLSLAVPRVANRRLSSVPRGVTAAEVERMLASCDRSSPAGLRDFAILKVLTRMGLRSGEVTRIELDDVDWRSGELAVRGKGNRRDRLPLPADVGTAIAAWLVVRRRTGPSRTVFIGAQAPLRALAPRDISHVVARACRRAGLPVVGVHQLRHGTAVQLLRAGAGFIEIGQVLRHARAHTTAIYAKADLTSLVLVAQPWPGAR